MWFIKKFCVLCLRSNVNLKSIYSKDVNNILIIDKLTYAVAIELRNNNLHNCPMYICNPCNKRLNSMYIYKKRCVKRINYITNCICKLNPTNANMSDVSVTLNKNRKSGIDCTNTFNNITDDSEISNEGNKNHNLCVSEAENDTKSEDINENLKYIKADEEIDIDYNLFEAHILNSDLKSDIKDEFDSNNYSETNNILLEIQLEEFDTEFNTENLKIDTAFNFSEEKIHKSKVDNSWTCTAKQLEENITNVQTEDDNTYFSIVESDEDEGEIDVVSVDETQITWPKRNSIKSRIGVKNGYLYTTRRNYIESIKMRKRIEEHKRRINLRDAFNELRILVPEVCWQDRATKIAILSEASTYCRRLTTESSAFQMYLMELRRQQRRLKARLLQLL